MLNIFDLIDIDRSAYTDILCAVKMKTEVEFLKQIFLLDISA